MAEQDRHTRGDTQAHASRALAVHRPSPTRSAWGLHPSWVIVLTGLFAALHVAKIPPALPALQAELGLSLLQAGFLLSSVQVASMSLGLLVGLSVDGLGLKRSMLFGLALLCAASTLGGFAQQAEVLLLLRAFEGLGFLCVVMPAPSLIRRTVLPQQLNARMGWWGTYMPSGNALALLVGPLWVASLGWHVWWWSLSAITLLSFFGCLWLCLTMLRLLRAQQRILPQQRPTLQQRRKHLRPGASACI